MPESILNFQSHSADVIISDDVAVLTFLAAIDGQDNIAVPMHRHELERLRSRITRALNAQTKPFVQD
jgi:hypothetical protein